MLSPCRGLSDPAQPTRTGQGEGGGGDIGVAVRWETRSFRSQRSEGETPFTQVAQVRGESDRSQEGDPALGHAVIYQLFIESYSGRILV